MKSSMKYIIALRAFGDFTILLNAICQSPLSSEVTIIASSHLKTLYDALSKYVNVSHINIAFHDFAIDKSQLSFFTNRFLLRGHTVKELWGLRNGLKNIASESIYVEQANRLLGIQLVSRKKVIPISKGKTVYRDYEDFFHVQLSMIEQNEVQSKVLVLPTARIDRRTFPDQVIKRIQEYYLDNASVCVAYFSKEARFTGEKTIFYESFDQLLELLNQFDLVYCPDTLTAHLCQMMHKPHVILYPENHNKSFLTPHVLRTGNHSSFFEFMLRRNN